VPGAGEEGRRVSSTDAGHVRSTTVAGLEAVAARGWQALETERMGGWLLRASGGFTGRANSVLPLGDPGLDLGAAIDAAVDWYGARGVAPRFLLPLPDAQPVDDELVRRGWRLGDVVHVLVAPLRPLAQAHEVDRAQGRPRVRVDAGPDEAWIGSYHYRGGELPPHARLVLENGTDLGFASVRSDGDAGDGRKGPVLAIARGSVDVDPSPGGIGWLGVTAVEVDPGVRRQGLAGLVLRGLAAWAVERGAAGCYLQVAAENEPALRLYAGAGFDRHHDYQYRLPPGDASRLI
jgi:N-acetylglutamate synthase